MHNKWTLKKAEFVLSAFSAKDYQSFYLPEVAFFGRSNAGKSTLINSLLSRKNLARVGKLPGKTRSINFFKIDVESEIDGQPCQASFHLADLPGFGFAARSKAEKRDWSELVSGYVAERKHLRAGVLVIDCRRQPEEGEMWVAGEFRHRAFFPVLTKVDRTSQSERAAALKTLQAFFGRSGDEAFLTGLGEKYSSIIGRLFDQICDTTLSIQDAEQPS